MTELGNLAPPPIRSRLDAVYTERAFIFPQIAMGFNPNAAPVPGFVDELFNFDPPFCSNARHVLIFNEDLFPFREGKTKALVDS